ncbi:MAG: Uma2 family endonuclease, partial [Cyanobacteria bacterium J06555_13]
LSPSTEANDRGDKFLDYQLFESLEEYVLINTKRKQVDVFRRAEGGLWLLQVYQEPEDNSDVMVELKSVELKISLSTLYEDVRLNTVETDAAKGT